MSYRRRRLDSSLLILLACVTTLALAGSIVAMTAAQATQAGDAIPPLIAAIWREDFDTVKRLIEQGADPNAHTGGRAQRPAWMWAIVARDAPATELLLSKVTTVDRATALQNAANRNDVSLARTLRTKACRSMPAASIVDCSAHRCGKRACRRARAADRAWRERECG